MKRLIQVEDLTNGIIQIFEQGKKVKMHNAWYVELIHKGLVWWHAPLRVTELKDHAALITNRKRYTLIG